LNKKQQKSDIFSVIFISGGSVRVTLHEVAPRNDDRQGSKNEGNEEVDVESVSGAVESPAKNNNNLSALMSLQNKNVCQRKELSINICRSDSPLYTRTNLKPRRTMMAATNDSKEMEYPVTVSFFK
jgi:hypothetical protein